MHLGGQCECKLWTLPLLDMWHHTIGPYRVTADMSALGRLISAVPRLGMACSAILTVAVPGSGLKLMRLVSKKLSSAMLGVVQRYTLQLDGRSGCIRTFALLQQTRLTHLRVVVSDPKISEWMMVYTHTQTHC